MIKLSLSVEELGLCLMLCGYEEIAAGIVKPTLGDYSDSEWETIFETASHSLLSKNIWDVQRHKEDKIPLAEEMIAFFSAYAESKKTLRFTEDTMGTTKLLMFHHIKEEEWIYHSVRENICHDFAIINSKAIPLIINEFYNIKELLGPLTTKIIIPEGVIKSLSEGVINAKELNHCKNEIKQNELAIFTEFTDDLLDKEIIIDNCSLIYLPSINEFPTVIDVMFIIKRNNKIWLVSQHDDEPNQPIYLIKPSYEEWTRQLYRKINNKMDT